MASGPRPSNRPFWGDAPLGVVNELQERVAAQVAAGGGQDGEVVQFGQPASRQRSLATGVGGAGVA